MALNLTVKTAVVRRTVTDPNNGHTYTIDGAIAVGTDAYGRCWAHVATGAKAEVVSVTPAQTTEAGSIINGAMLNPTRVSETSPVQGWDQRMNNWSAGANLTFPALVEPNDIIQKVQSQSAFASRSGYFTGESALHILDHTPTGEYLLPSPVGWVGRTTFDEYPVDTTAWLAAKSTHSGGTWTSYASIAECLAKASPAMAYRWGVDNAGYEGFSTYFLGRPVAWGGTSVNYGQRLARMLGEVMTAMTSTNYTTEQRRRMCIAIARMGLDWGEAALRGPSDAYYGPDGGHFQWAGYPLVHALDLIGENASIPNVQERAGGNMKNCFVLTAGVLSTYFVPHTSSTLPAMYRRRTLAAQPGGSVVRIPCSSANGDRSTMNIPVGAIITQFGGAKTATVLTKIDLATTGTVDVQLTGASPFLSGEEVYVDYPAEWKTEGLGEFSIRGIGDPAWDIYVSLSRDSTYRSVQNWGSQLMAICHLGLYDSTMEAARKYMQRSMEAANPSASNDYQDTMASWDASNLANPTWFLNNVYVPI